jgi:hypothetical protein
MFLLFVTVFTFRKRLAHNVRTYGTKARQGRKYVKSGMICFVVVAVIIMFILK